MATRQIEAAQAEAAEAAAEVARVEARAAEDRDLLLERAQQAEDRAGAVANQALQLWDCAREAALRAQASLEDALQLVDPAGGEELAQAWRVAAKQKADLDALLPQLHLSLSDPGTPCSAPI